MQRYDIAIIGTGPAGLEAAITAKLRNKNILLLGRSELSEKIEKAHAVGNYLGLPEISGEEMRRAFLEHLSRAGLEITDDSIKTVYAMGGYFSLQGRTKMYESRTVILACGLSAVKPIEGENENLGSGVSYCATCDAMLYRGKSVSVIGYSEGDEAEAAFLAEVADKVCYIPMYEISDKAFNEAPNITVRQITPRSIKRVGQKMILVSAGGEIETDGIFVLRESLPPARLVPGLKIENNHAVTDGKMRTSVRGLFACGDITGPPYQYIKAAGEGNVAALSAVEYLSNIKQ